MLLLPRLLAIAQQQTRHDARNNAAIQRDEMRRSLLNRSHAARECHEPVDDISDWYSLLSFLVALVGLDFTTLLMDAGFTSVIDNQNTTTSCTEYGRWPLGPPPDSSHNADDVAPY